MLPPAHRFLPTLVVLSLAWFLPVAHAADPATQAPIPRLFGMFQPEPGVWAEYAVTDKGSGEQSVMRMAIVGQEKQAHWYEVTNVERDHRNVVKMLVKGDPNDPENIERMIIKSGENPAAEMPRDFVAMGRKMAVHMFERRSGVPPEEAPSLKVEKLGQREVTVPAGTFSATRHRIVDQGGEVLATYDFVPEVKPFGVVTSNTGSTVMELLGYGRDARSAITETPVPLTTPPGMPRGMPRGIPPGMSMPEGKIHK